MNDTSERPATLISGSTETAITVKLRTHGGDSRKTWSGEARGPEAALDEALAAYSLESAATTLRVDGNEAPARLSGTMHTGLVIIDGSGPAPF
jgi:hypothetical protein